MKRLLLLMYNLYFFERVIYWAFLVSAACLTASIFASGKFSDTLKIISLFFIVGLPIFSIIGHFTTQVANRHLSLVPYWRQQLLLAVFSLMVILSLFVGFVLTSLNKTTFGFGTIILTTFSASSIALVLAQMFFRSRIAMALIGYGWVIIYLTLKDFAIALWKQVPDFDSVLMVIVLCSTCVLLWLGLIVWLNQAKQIDSIFKTKYSRSDSKVFTSIYEKMGWNIIISGPLTLLMGVPFYKNSRLWKLLAIYLLAPLTATTFLVLMLNSGESLLNQKNGGAMLLAMQFMGVLVLPAMSSEWVTRLRFLWLKIPGSRKEFWLFWRKSVHNEIKFALISLVIYAAAIRVFFDISDVSLAAYAVTIFIVLPASCYLAVWLRLLHANKITFGLWIGIVYLLANLFCIVISHASQNMWAVVLLGLLSFVVGLLAYYFVKKGFKDLDWLLLRPSTHSQIEVRSI